VKTLTKQITANASGKATEHRAKQQSSMGKTSCRPNATTHTHTKEHAQSTGHNKRGKKQEI
jgi:hypothetical protein